MVKGPSIPFTRQFDGRFVYLKKSTAELDGSAVPVLPRMTRCRSRVDAEISLESGVRRRSGDRLPVSYRGQNWAWTRDHLLR
jgi:hypothetical protein